MWDLSSGKLVGDTKGTKAAAGGSGGGAGAGAGAGASASLIAAQIEVQAAGKEGSGLPTAAVTSVRFSRGDGGRRLLVAAKDNCMRVLDARSLAPTSIAPLR